MGQTVVEKIARAHMAEGPSRPLRSGDFLSIRPRHVMTHDNTAPVMTKFRAIGAAVIHDRRQPVFVLDHDIQNTSAENLNKYRSIEAFAMGQGIEFHPAGTGIGHQVMVEQQYVVPGSFVVASDSHANMYGALGAIGTPVVRTDAAAIWATGTFWWQIPRSVRVVLTGELPPGSVGKDVIVALCGLYRSGEVLNASVEFVGPGVATLGIEDRLAISNMTTEWGALIGWFPADAVALAFVRSRRSVLASRGIERVSDDQLVTWERRPLAPDADAVYAGEIRLDLSRVAPHVAGPDSVQVATALDVLERRSIAVQKAYLVSCVNSRAGDIAAAARVLKGKRVADGVELYVAAASKEVQIDAEERGHWQTLLDAGARPLPAGCGPCIGLGAGLLEPGEVGISATNRNFKGRMGSRDAECYLASPEVVAASAIAGKISAPGSIESRPPLVVQFDDLTRPAVEPERVAILDGFPEMLRGRMLLLPYNDVDTDGIYGKDHTYRDDIPPETMARMIFENYDPGLARKVRQGDVIVGGWNFGSGSSREQAVTALQAAGISMVIAGSYAQTYLRNAFNNGFPCVTCPELVERVRELLASEIAAGKKALMPGDTLEIDFAAGTIRFREDNFPFPTLGAVPQALVVAGGVENLVRQRLGLS